MISWENHLRPYIDDFCVFEKEGAFGGLTKTPVILAKNGTSKQIKWTRAEDFLKNLVDFEEVELYLTKVIAIIYAVYQDTLERKNVADFDDLINKTIYILKNNSIVRAYYQKYFKHLIIDEFQDTNGSQLELIKLLLNETSPNITFVGDRKQSIYGFRYAQMENLEILHRFIEEKYHQKYPEIKLETNYRSTSHVLNAVNYVTEEHLQLQEGLNACELKTVKEENKYVKNVEIINCNSAQERKDVEAVYIASEIQRLKKEENVKYKDFAILVKSHAQSELIEKTLTKYGIPSIKKTNKGFFTSDVIKNAKAVLLLIKNPLNEIALTRLLKVNLTDKQLLEVKKSIDFLYLENIGQDKEKYPNLCEKILKLIEEKISIPAELESIFNVLTATVKNKYNCSLLQLFTSFTQQVSLFKPKSETEDFQANLKIRTFEKIIADYEQRNAFTTISNFLEFLEKAEEDRNFELPSVLSSDIDAVQIMTIHASKGLEFEYTFVCAISNRSRKNDGRMILDLQYGKKPGFGLIITKLNEKNSPKNLVYREVWQKPRDLNEAIRLFYVATSRAEKYLNILTYTDKGSSKSAFYTKDFPKYVLKEDVDLAQINLEKEPIKMMKMQTSKGNKPIVFSQELSEKEINHKFSFSKINTFKNCPNKFLLKYKYGFPSLSEQNKGTQIGSIVHKLIYNSLVHNQNYDLLSLNELLTQFDVEESAKPSIITSYNNFILSQYSPQSLANKEYIAEHNFNFIYKIEDKEIEFNGDIDLLVKNDDNTYSIIDFKTNANIDKEKENYYAQLYLYKKAIEAQGLKVKSAEILSLNDNGAFNSFYFENENKIKQEFEENIKLAIECFEQEKTVKCNLESKKCAFCEYNYICS